MTVCFCTRWLSRQNVTRRFSKKEESLSGKTVLNTDVGQVLVELVGREKRFLEGKLREAKLEKEGAGQLFPPLSETMQRIQELWGSLEGPAVEKARDNFNELFGVKKAAKRVKIGVVGTLSTASKSNPQTTKSALQIRPKYTAAKWDKEEEILFLSELTRAESEHKKVTQWELSEDDSRSQEPKVAKLIVLPVPAKNSSVESQHVTALPLCSLNYQNHATLSTIETQEDTPTESVQTTAKTSISTISSPKKTNVKSELKTTCQTQTVTASKQPTQAIPTTVNSDSINAYILHNRANLTDFDLTILNSMAKCYLPVDRGQSRFMFAAKQPQGQGVQSTDMNPYGPLSPRSQTANAIQQCQTVTNLITSFFKDKEELLRSDPAPTERPEQNRYYRLFNQSYTFERPV